MVKIPKIKEVENSEKKRKRVSKKTKKAWRKHVDTNDVDQFMESKRLDERLGAPFSERQDAELFVVDSAPDKNLINKLNDNSKAAKRLALRNSLPKCYSSLLPHTAVPDPISKRNRVKTPEERKNPITKRIEESRRINGELKLKEKVALKNRDLYELKKKNRFKRGQFGTDVWAEESNISKKRKSKTFNSEWLTTDTVRQNTRTDKARLALKPTINQVSVVETPHPGTSYNPSYEDHQQLLREIAEKEMKLIKEEEHLDRVTTKMFKKVSPAENQKIWLKESSEGLPETKGGSKVKTEDEEIVSGEVTSVNPPVKINKKTRVQRRKQKEQKKLAFELKKAKVEKKKIGDIYKLKALKKQIAGKELQDQEMQKRREEIAKRKEADPKVLSRTKFEAPELDFKMGQDLTGNLRGSDPVGNLLRDRYKSMQQRNIVAPSTRSFKLNKAKVKKFVKPDHKITWEGKPL